MRRDHGDVCVASVRFQAVGEVTKAMLIVSRMG